MSKTLNEMTFEELVSKCSEIELEALIKGEGSIHDRIWRICELSIRWREKQLEAAGKLKK